MSLACRAAAVAHDDLAVHHHCSPKAVLALLQGLRLPEKAGCLVHLSTCCIRPNKDQTDGFAEAMYHNRTAAHDHLSSGAATVLRRLNPSESQLRAACCACLHQFSSQAALSFSMCTGGTGDNVLHAMTYEKIKITAMSQTLHSGLAMRSYRVTTIDRYS